MRINKSCCANVSLNFFPARFSNPLRRQKPFVKFKEIFSFYSLHKLICNTKVFINTEHPMLLFLV